MGRAAASPLLMTNTLSAVQAYAMPGLLEAGSGNRNRYRYGTGTEPVRNRRSGLLPGTGMWNRLGNRLGPGLALIQ